MALLVRRGQGPKAPTARGKAALLAYCIAYSVSFTPQGHLFLIKKTRIGVRLIQRKR